MCVVYTVCILPMLREITADTALVCVCVVRYIYNMNDVNDVFLILFLTPRMQELGRHLPLVISSVLSAARDNLLALVSPLLDSLASSCSVPPLSSYLGRADPIPAEGGLRDLAAVQVTAKQLELGRSLQDVSSACLSSVCVCVHACVCVCACMRVCVRTRVCVCVCACDPMPFYGQGVQQKCTVCGGCR